MDNPVDRDSDVYMNNINRGRDPLLFFPYVSLPPMFRIAGQTPLETLQDTVESCGEYGIYVDGKWVIKESPSATTPEQWLPKFLNRIINAARFHNSKNNPRWYLSSRDDIMASWQMCGNALIEGVHKPNVVLVPFSPFPSPPITFRQVYSYCEFKYSFDQDLEPHMLRQLTEIAGYACAAQIDRRFFVASSLCERMFTLAFFVHGSIVFSKAFNIDKDPLLFVTVILGLSNPDTVWNGFDPNMYFFGGNFATCGISPKLRLQEPLLYSSQALYGRGTKVLYCIANDELNCIKISWLPMDNKGQSVTTDIEIYQWMEERMPLLEALTGREKELFGEQDLYGVFHDCIKPAKHETSKNKWDYIKHLPGIPIVLSTECSRPCAINPRPNDSLRSEGYYSADYNRSKDFRPDTTSNIIQRFDVPVQDAEGQQLPSQLFIEHRERIWVLSRTCGTSLVWFSCQRELVNTIMGALAGHFNGLRMGLLHCDISDSNVWIEIEGSEVNYVVPDWPKDEDTHPKRAGMLGDWGYATDLREKGSEPGHVTGTFPFMAAELLSGDKSDLRHTVEHDLESFFWLLWIVCVNLNGPFYTRRVWKDKVEDITKQGCVNPDGSGPTLPMPTTPPLTVDALSATSISPVATTMSLPPPVTAPHSQCETRDSGAGQGLASSIVGQPVEYGCPTRDTHLRLPYGEPARHAAPIWATPGAHSQGTNDVRMFKTGTAPRRIMDAVSPYFRDCQAFMDGLNELCQYFGSEGHRRGKITHVIFYDILKKMYDGIDPKQDRTSNAVIKAGRKRYETLIEQEGERGISVSVLEEVPIETTVSGFKRAAESYSTNPSAKRARTSSAVSTDSADVLV